jgi:hypothetical protein
MKSLALTAAISTLAWCAGAQAASQVSLLTPVSFAPSTDARAEVRDECKLGEQLETRVGDALRRSNKGPGTTTSTQGDVLKVTVTTIWGARGNNWTGPKGLAIHADLMHDGTVARSTDFHRTTMGGIWGPFKGICGFMDRNAESIGKDLARWSRDAKYELPQEAPVETAPAASASVK